MEEPYWERPVCLVCDYWLPLLALLALLLAAYFSRNYWRPLVGLQPAPQLQLGTGDIQATLRWSSTNDIDLWVTDPDGNTISYRSPSSPSGGELDVDANAACNNLTSQPVENIFWPPGAAPGGEYAVSVHYYAQCEDAASTPYEVRVMVDGEVQEFDGTLTAENEQQPVFSFRR